ncbi:patatin-like phospholipase family protein [Microvirga sp. HBU67558]|uniref:patatin-like phospholipase family protein n=1 Tax=Microvirga TaxID=186650 RepID=UPI001B3819C2|nr:MULTISPECIES: patatin-like phospholipase family protein [unclassified Microvirga]MBQ0820942.1 patatin-like phospholipase family protein [Microvirga sp. HBU67558]
MKRIGLALSGGGFRATLYHLGLVRFLHDAGILPNVSVITAVSGGSIIAAHLGLNWSRYNGSAREFDAAASEVLAFTRLDVRNRILRRYPLAFPIRGARRLAGLSNRKLTRPGLLEQHYEKYLYGDTSLFQLPESPSLHLLATNLSEGSLCSFNRDGLWIIRRGEKQASRIDRIPIGLATVPMAVAASSAFPGFFPPTVLTGADVGATVGDFGRQAYTDGGVFDNLGVRMFHCLAQAFAPDQLPWDGILVSDAGRPFEIQGARAGGLVRTAIRASDILMDRVWQLETETFRDTSGFAFARITEVIDPEQDRTALHPEVQRQLPNIRTDLDRFSPIEISSLMRHGYCVGREATRRHPDVLGTELPDGPASESAFETCAATSATANGSNVLSPRREPKTRTLVASTARRVRNAFLDWREWMARAAKTMIANGSSVVPLRRGPTAVTRTARSLHASAGRRIWSTLLDYRDWVSYVYVPILVPILVLAPYFVIQAYERSQRINQIVESLAQESRDLEQMTRLLNGEAAPFVSATAEELRPDDTADLTGFTILQDLRIIDLRHWNSDAGGSKALGSVIYGYRRVKVRKEPESASNTFRISVLAISPDTQVRFPPQQLKPQLYSRSLTGHDPTENLRHWEVGVEFGKVPAGETVDIIYEHRSPGLFLRAGIASTSLTFDIEADTIELDRWLLLPQGREYRTFQLIRYPTGRLQPVESVTPVTEFRSNDFTILAFRLLALKAGYSYDLTWFYR